MAVPPTSPAPPAPEPTKPELRVVMRGARAAFVATLDAATRGRLERDLAARVAPLLVGKAAVAGYAALPDEIDPRFVPFGIRPRVVGRGLPLTLHRATRQQLRPGVWGILEPTADAPQHVPDAVLLPLLAADVRGNRLGYGAGHYDRTLAGSTALRIGVAWDCQVVAALPAELWDVPLDWLVTPTRTICCRDASAVGDAAATR